MLIQVTLADDELWQCSECQRWLPFSDGQDDDFPGWCDECWTAHEAAKKEETPVPEWFADDPPFTASGLYRTATTAADMKQQLLDELCSDCHDHSDQWYVTFRHIWDTLED
jgi:hypothetical protein